MGITLSNAAEVTDPGYNFHRLAFRAPGVLH